MGPGAIPLSEIRAYLDLHGVDDPDERVDYVRFVRAMDERWLARQSRRGKTGS